MAQSLLISFVFILTNTVIAQAGNLELGSVARKIHTSAWTATHAGTTELDGMPVVAALEQSDTKLNIPNFMVAFDSEVPLAAPKPGKYRLTLVAQNQPEIQVSFPLLPRPVVSNGETALTFQSEARLGDQFEFAIVPRSDGTLLVKYRRANDENSTGEFVLSPLPQLFRK